MAMNGLALSAAGNALANIPQDIQGLQMGQEKVQLGQQQVALGQRQAAEMQGLQRAAQEARDPNTGQLDQNKFVGLVGQYAPSHLPGIMQSSGMMAYRQAQAGNQKSLESLHDAQEDKTNAQTGGINLDQAAKMDQLTSGTAQAMLQLKKPDGTPDLDARTAYLKQREGALQQYGIDTSQIKGMELNDENLGAYAKMGLKGHDYAQLYDTARSEIGKVGQDEKNNFISHEWADRERKKLVNIKEGITANDRGGPTLTPIAKSALIENYHLYGMEAFKGMRGLLTKDQIGDVINGEADEYKLASRDWQQNLGNLKASMSSQAVTQKTRDAIVSFEKVAQQNGEAAMNILKKVADVGSPMFNMPIRTVMERMGDADVHALDAQLDVYSKEVARITTNPALNGVLTESERKDLRSMTEKDIPVGQFQKLLQVYGADMERRSNSMNAMLSEQKQRIPSIQPKSEGGGGVNRDAEIAELKKLGATQAEIDAALAKKK